MKTLSFIGTGRYHKTPVLVDFNKNTVEEFTRMRSAIDEVYIAPEDIEIRYRKGNKTVVLKAEKGDIIVTFYDEEWVKNPIVVVKNKDWKANVVEQIKIDESNKAKEMAEASYCNEDCECVCCNR